MQFLVAFHQLEAIGDLEGRCVTGLFPHLRLVSLLPADVTAHAASRLPLHLRDRVVLHPSPELIESGLHGVLSTDRRETAQILPALPPEVIFGWGGLNVAYQRWLHAVYLPYCATAALYSPENLYPSHWSWLPVTLEIIGGPEAYFMEQAVPSVATQLGLDLRAYHSPRRHLAASRRPDAPEPTGRVVVPPLDEMLPNRLDDIVLHPDHRRLFEEAQGALYAHLDSVLAGYENTSHFVAGFIEPVADPLGWSFGSSGLSNFKFFVRCLNDALMEWCNLHPTAWFVDANETAALIGKAYVDPGPIAHYSDRTPLDPYDDWVERDDPLASVPVRQSFCVRSSEFYAAVLREVCVRLAVLSGRGRVDAVIVDLDNTLWRGLASDQALGPWKGRPQGLIEALQILKRRGVLLAVASKNDEASIRRHWDRILHDYADVPLGCAFDLEDFDSVRIDFRPKSVTVGEIMEELGVLDDAVVFVDDNPLEREEVQAAFPALRVLGAEMNYVRRELLFSPFTQAAPGRATDGSRSTAAHQLLPPEPALP